jgi:hypothetical protein
MLPTRNVESEDSSCLGIIAFVSLIDKGNFDGIMGHLLYSFCQFLEWDRQRPIRSHPSGFNLGCIRTFCPFPSGFALCLEGLIFRIAGIGQQPVPAP